MANPALLVWVQDSALGVLLRQSDPLLVQVVQLFHVFGLILLLASLLLLNLRVFGIGLTQLPLERVAKASSGLFWPGLVSTLISGSVMFLSAPLTYFHNPAFFPKVALLLAALISQSVLYRNIPVVAAFHPLQVKGTALIALLLWFSTGFAGRAIGFV